MRTVKRKTTLPWCTCNSAGEKGFTKHPGPNTYWVHPTCMKVTKAVYERHGGVPLEYFP